MSDGVVTEQVFRLTDLTARLDERQRQMSPDILQKNFQILQEQLDKLSASVPPERVMAEIKELAENVNSIRQMSRQINENFAVRLGTLEATLREMIPELSPELQHHIQEITRISAQEAEAKKAGK